MLAEQPHVFSPDRLWIMDRNFPGVPRIAAMLATGSHVLIRVKSDIRLPRIGPFAADGSYLTRLSGGGTSLTMRVDRVPRQRGRADHTRAVLPGHRPARPHHPPRAPVGAGLPVALGRLGDRAAGGQVDPPRRRTRAPGRSCAHTTPELIRQEHAAWIVATELVHAATRSAAAIAAPFRKGPRTGQPVAARHLSFTTARRTLIATVRAGTATASLPAPARAAAHQRALAVIATARVTTDRHRHRDHKIKSRQPFPHAPRGITTRTAPAHVHVCGTAA